MTLRWGTTAKASAATLAALVLASCLYANTDHQINYGLNHYRMGLHRQAIPPLLGAAETLERTDPRDPRLPEVLLALAEMASADRRVDLAESFYRKAVKAADELTTPDENALRNALVSGGHFYLAQGRPNDALPWFERAARISERSPQFRRTLHAIDLDNLGLAYSYQKRSSEGRAFGLRALKVLDEAKGEADAAKTRGVVLYNLGFGFMEDGRHAEAEVHFRRALDILAREAPAAGETWRVRVVLTNYAALLRKLGREKEAQALERRKDELPPR